MLLNDLIKSLVDQYKAGAKTQAEFNVKADLVLTAIIEKEGIKVTEEELNEEVSKLAESYKVEEERLEAFKQSILESSKNYIEDSIQKRKVIDILVENAKFIDKVEEKAEDK